MYTHEVQDGDTLSKIVNAIQKFTPEEQGTQPFLWRIRQGAERWPKGVSYSVEIGKSAEEEIDKLSFSLFLRIDKTIQKLKGEPRLTGVIKLKGDQEAWRARVGDWRFIYEIDDNAQIVRIKHVRHRSEAYHIL